MQTKDRFSRNNVYVEGPFPTPLKHRCSRDQIQNWLPETLDPYRVDPQSVDPQSNEWVARCKIGCPRL